MRDANVGVSDADRRRIASALAQKEITGIGQRTFLEFEKKQMDIPRQIKTCYRGDISISEHGLFLHPYLQEPYTRRIHQPGMGASLIPKANEGTEYFLVDIHYTTDFRLDTRYVREFRDHITPQFSIAYTLNGSQRREEFSLENEARGVVSFLTDVERGDFFGFGNVCVLRGSFYLKGASVLLRAIEVRPVN